MEFIKEKRCDECEKEAKTVLFCSNCVEFLCEDCDARIHNKGTRVSHLRFVHSNEFYHEKSPSKFLITFFTSQMVKIEGNTIQDVMRKFIQEKLIKEASKGILQIELEKLATELGKEYQMNDHKALYWIEKQSEIGLWNLNVRIFDSCTESRFISLNLSTVSVQAIIWVLMSIKNDCMQPTETLIHSRFKECFNVKVTIKDWKLFIEEVTVNFKLLKKMNRYKDIFGEVDVQTTNEGVVIFTIKNNSWPYEDLLKVDPENFDYREFLNFIDTYLADSLIKPEEDCYLSAENKKKNQSDYHTLMKKKSYSSGNSFYSEFNKIKESYDKKSVRGGKYGCAMMVKNCGTERLKHLSIGHLIALISLALHQQIIIHHKTLIIKNTKKKEENSLEREAIIRNVQRIIIEILTENNKKGVTLAQLPFFISRKMGKTFNFEELGFPKLKNFLVTLEDKILLEKSHNNHIKIFLKGCQPTDPSKHYFEPGELNNESQEKCLSEKVLGGDYTLGDKKQGSLKPNPFDVKTKKINQNDFYDHKKSYSTYQQYFQSVEAELVTILNRYRCGIELSRLEKLLSTYKYNYSFNSNRQEDFQDFLINNFDQYLQIIVSRKKYQGKYVLIVYPRSFGFINNQTQRFNEYGFAQNFEEQQRNYGTHLLESSFSSSQTSSVNKKKDSFFKGFEYQIISPIPSPSTTNLYPAEDSEPEQDPEYEDENNADSNSFQNIRKLILEESN